MWDVTSWHPDTKTTKFEPQTNGHQTAKQHGLAGSTDPFLNHISPGPGGKTSRLDPLKNCTLLVRLSWSPYSCPIQNAFETRPWFCSDKVKARPGRFTKPIFRNCSWCDILTPTHQNHQIRAPNGGHQTAKQHGLAGSRDPFLNHISPSPGGKTSRLYPLKNCTLLVQALEFPAKHIKNI